VRSQSLTKSSNENNTEENKDPPT